MKIYIYQRESGTMSDLGHFHYSNTPIQLSFDFNDRENDHFFPRKIDMFLIFAVNPHYNYIRGLSQTFVDTVDVIVS